MIQFIDDLIYYDYSHCQQCGICEVVFPKQAISLKRLDDGTHEVVVDDDKCIRCKRCVNVCSANKRGYFDGYFNEFEGKRYFLGCNNDNAIRWASFSGGVCKTIVIESLRIGRADGKSRFFLPHFSPFTIFAATSAFEVWNSNMENRCLTKK